MKIIIVCILATTIIALLYRILKFYFMVNDRIPSDPLTMYVNVRVLIGSGIAAVFVFIFSAATWFMYTNNQVQFDEGMVIAKNSIIKTLDIMAASPYLEDINKASYIFIICMFSFLFAFMVGSKR